MEEKKTCRGPAQSVDTRSQRCFWMQGVMLLPIIRRLTAVPLNVVRVWLNAFTHTGCTP